MPNNADKRRCSECGARTPRDAALCTSCGANMARSKEAAQCPSCGARMSPQGVCPICGAQGQVAPPTQRSSRVWMALLALVLLLLGGAGWVFGGEQIIALWLAQMPSRHSESASAGGNPSSNLLSKATIAINIPQEAQKLLAAVVPTATPTVTLTPTASIEPTETVQPTATATWTATSTPQPSATPTPTPSPMPSPTELPEPTAAPTPEMETYEVKSGDNPWTIARQFDLTTEDLLAANGLTERSMLRVGQVLQIPRTGSAESASTTEAAVVMAAATPEPLIHTVASGDTIGALAVRYSVSSAEIARVNNITLNKVLSVGETLIIPVNTPSPTATATGAADDVPALAVDATSTATDPAAPTATPTAAPTSTPEPVVHTVASGDTIGALAVRYGVSSAEIARVNNISLNQVLRIGDTLVIPDTTPSPTPTTPVAAGDSLALAVDAASAATAAADATPTPSPEAATPSPEATAPSPEATAPPTPASTSEPMVHVVARGDTLGGLAVRYGVSSAEIARANNISLNRMLSIGDRLIIPGADSSPTSMPEATATPTHTPTATPTITRTPSPTNTPLPRFPYRAPYLLGPPRESVFVGADARILLNWTSVGILAPREWYALYVWSPGDDQPTRVLTKASSWRLPARMYPEDTNDRSFTWQVVVVLKGTDADSQVSISLPSDKRTFSWH